MSFVSKLKNFFYEEEEVEEEVVEKPKKVEKEKKINIYDIEKEKTRATLKNKKDLEDNEIPERELFKSERTFNFPMDMDEEDDFEPAMDRSRRQVQETRKEVDIETHVNRVTRSNFSSKSSSNTQTTRNYSSVNYEPLIHKKEEKKFKPTPIISPVYGILDKNYNADGDRNLSQTKEFNLGSTLDFDTVRKKAYGEEEKKNIFYNLDENNKNSGNEESENIDEEYKEKPYKKDEVIITYEQVPEESKDDEVNDEKEIEVPKITRSKKLKKKIEEDEEDNKILDETKEHDLFDLIDNMYSEEEEEDE